MRRQKSDRMNREQLEYFRNLLTHKVDQLLADAEKTLVGMTDDNENLPDITDRASLESDRNFELRIRDRERKLISKMREALTRIDDGTYGLCEVCGGDISEKRLMARPVTTLCFDCKTKQEKLEKQRGE
ncbi:MAG TPA: RNA polymerase-binding protein DksA [Syntrophales bacterium]|nr:RNA polymerase-binding protein DksA [Syntrophales bacterium]HPX11278.1 RNA polymerase-binding protein DksA [Syntrophales bacterium]HQB29849.1 RNA polymerase-binding protein DksA [Syntrophales bacterium]HQN77237.1 RNA polymerase-binding protein DksA [Syntrophales bacterium]HQQ26241.1 RNA polymerase-binding protein DksA [Syntrophales bacterium]